jgi:cytochrome bd ubiquinol oxidase subunit II
VEILFAFFLAGYFMLSGFDVGVGMLLPLLAQGVRSPGANPTGNEDSRRLVLATIAPFFLSNEVWLVATLGLASGAYPAREAALFGRVTPAVVALIIGWIVRDMGLWLRGRLDSSRWRLACDTAIVAGSWTIAVSWGAAVGVLLGGGLAMILPIVAYCCAFAAHGAVFATLRLPQPPLFLSRRLAQGLLPITTLVMVGLALLAVSRLPGGAVSGHSTQTLLIAVTVSALPLMLAAQAWVWWTFRARVEGPSYL